jgi:5-methylthioribose kinase
MRRVAGWSHAADLESLPSDAAPRAQRAVFDAARHWIVTGTAAPLTVTDDPTSPENPGATP